MQHITQNEKRGECIDRMRSMSCGGKGPDGRRRALTAQSLACSQRGTASQLTVAVQLVEQVREHFLELVGQLREVLVGNSLRGRGGERGGSRSTVSRGCRQAIGCRGEPALRRPRGATAPKHVKSSDTRNLWASRLERAVGARRAPGQRCTGETDGRRFGAGLQLPHAPLPPIRGATKQCENRSAVCSLCPCTGAEAVTARRAGLA